MYCYTKWNVIPLPSLQIIFVYKQVISQAKDKFWPDKKPVWSDKFFFCR